MDLKGICLVMVILLLKNTVTAQEKSFQRINEGITSIKPLNIPSTVEKVVLTGNKITELKTGDFENLAECVSLHLGDNKIHIIKAGAFRGLTNLLDLYLHFNDLRTFPDLTDLPKLKELTLHSNELYAIPPGSAHVLPNNHIEVLDLKNTKLIAITSDFLEKFPNLIEMNLQNNDIKETPHIDVISDHLEVLDLSNNPINSLDPSFFKTDKPSVLKVFKFAPSASVTAVSGFEDFFTELTNLKEIEISSWGLTKLPDFSGIIGILRKLTITNNPNLEEIDLKMLFGDPPDYSQDVAMTDFILRDNGLTHISGEILSAMTNLTTLNLRGNQLTTFPMPQLQNLKYLQHVFLEENNIKTFCDIGHRNKRGELRIDISGNPLVCNSRLCWLFDSGYVVFKDERLEYPCAEPSNMASVSWSDFTGDDIGCSGSSEPYGCSTPKPVTPDSNGDGTSDGSQASGNDSDFPLVPIAGGAVGGLVLILCIIIGFLLYKRKSKAAQESDTKAHNEGPVRQPAQTNAFKNPNDIFMPEEKGSKTPVYTNFSYPDKEDDVHIEIHDRNSRMMQELGDVKEIGLQTFYSNGNVAK